MMILTKETKRRLRGLPVQRLAQMWCELNGWKWPDEIADIKPENIHPHPPTQEINETLGWAVMEEIRFLIADKTILREWNKAMDDEEFNRMYIGDPLIELTSR
jgi:hypothetical protein